MPSSLHEVYVLCGCTQNLYYGSFTLTETDSDTESDSDSKLDGYIVLCRTCSHCTDSDADNTPYFYVGQEFESESIPRSVSGNVNEPLHNAIVSVFVLDDQVVGRELFCSVEAVSCVLFSLLHFLTCYLKKIENIVADNGVLLGILIPVLRTPVGPPYVQHGVVPLMRGLYS